MQSVLSIVTGRVIRRGSNRGKNNKRNTKNNCFCNLSISLIQGVVSTYLPVVFGLISVVWC